jgi:hypothetical protein
VPDLVADGEVVIRAVFYPHHLNKSGEKLKKNAFRSPPDKDEVSTIRRAFVSDQFCKDKALDIDLRGRCRGDEKKEFRGFAAISAKRIREFGSAIVDSREVFLCHADIRHGFIVARNEPLPSELNDRLDRLKDAARFIPDPSPRAWRWAGGGLNVKT